jgi:hypothetical protein
MDGGIGEYATKNIYCSLTIVEADFDKSSFGIVMPQQWSHIQDIDVSLLSLREPGALDTLRSKWFVESICPDTPDTPTCMGIESSSSLFLTFAVISILSVVLFVWRKPYQIRDYLLAVTNRKDFLTHIRISMIRRASKSP